MKTAARTLSGFIARIRLNSYVSHNYKHVLFVVVKKDDNSNSLLFPLSLNAFSLLPKSEVGVEAEGDENNLLWKLEEERSLPNPCC